MADLYWVTFRLHEDRTREQRYTKLMDNIEELVEGMWWTEPTSFVLFPSNTPIDDLTAHLSTAINEETDIVLIGMPDYKQARVIGAVTDDDLFTIWPWVQRA